MVREDIIIISLELFGLAAAAVFVFFFIRFWWRCRQRYGFLLFFTREIIFAVESNLPIVPSLKVLAEGLRKRYFVGVVEDVLKAVYEGESLSASLSRQKHVFPSLYVRMVAIGEESGNLAQVLREILEHLKTKEDFKYQLNAGLTYPCFLVIVATCVLLFLVTFIMPTFADMFKEMDVSLPALTLFLISFSYWLKAYFLWIFLAILTAIGLAVMGFSASRRNASFNRALMRFPFLGTLMRNMALVRLSRNLAMFLRCSFPLSESLESISSVPFNIAFQEATLSMKKGVEEGEKLSESMRRTGLFPSTSMWFASLGEERGNLEEAFLQIADFYGLAVGRALRRINILTIPIATIFVGAAIGCIATGVFSALVGIVEELI